MDWNAVQAVAESVGALGVIISLIYLAAQVRQNTRAIRSAANQDLLTSYNAILEVAKTSPHGAHVYETRSLQQREHAVAGELGDHSLVNSGAAPAEFRVR